MDFKVAVIYTIFSDFYSHWSDLKMVQGGPKGLPDRFWIDQHIQKTSELFSQTTTD